jgi:predicted AlkP superfamily pyrophosphatase or phosphodiesterase
MPAKRRLLVINVAALDATLASRLRLPDAPPFTPLTASFPALTCSAQAAFRTGQPAANHGMIANGVYTPPLRKILFWEQAASLVEGPRIWDAYRAAGHTVGLLFWQQSLGENADLIVSPRPIHKHSGGMIQAVYTQPDTLYPRLRDAAGRDFNLLHYWGPLASAKGSEWITTATCAVLDDPEHAPDLLLTYLPHLDYDLQRHGPDHPRAQRALDKINGWLSRLWTHARQRDYDVLIFGDYAIGPADHGALFPNALLRMHNLFRIQPVRQRTYPDLWASRAFAMVDHEIAHIYIPNPADRNAVRDLFENVAGIEHVLDRDAQKDWQINHPRSGDLLLIAAPGYWFAYPWWVESHEAPDFATHVDIHNKPGFDPCELYFGWPPGSISRDTSRIKGSHGRTDPNRQTAWTASFTPENTPTNIAHLGQLTSHWLTPPKKT